MGNDGNTTLKSKLALNGISYQGKSRPARSGGSWLEYLQPDYGIDEADDEVCSVFRSPSSRVFPRVPQFPQLSYRLMTSANK